VKRTGRPEFGGKAFYGEGLKLQELMAYHRGTELYLLRGVQGYRPDTHDRAFLCAPRPP
jgi:hypothetical protein